jgi:uncharacterized protein (DUF983 family)
VSEWPVPPGRTRWWRAIRRRCPVCDQGQLFHRWLKLTPRCPRCGLVFERAEGAWTASLGINTVVSSVCVFGVILGIFLLSYPSVPIGAMLISALTVAIVFPIAFFPFSKTIWLAIDLGLHPLEAGETTTRTEPTSPETRRAPRGE